jgi:hypothetical protein
MTPAATFADQLRDRLQALREGPAFRAYLDAREHVLAMKRREQSEAYAGPSGYWQEELANVEYLLDASPLVIEKLRQHCFHVTGIRVYDYRTHRPSHDFEHKLRALIQLGGRELLVPEPRALGGFGFEIEGQLYNLDTLKFYEVLIALSRGGALSELRGRAERKLVWEIGAGWGGFAYQFKTVVPDTTYVITDLPELFLFSAVYLRTLFPDARVLFFDRARPEELERWQEYDFVLSCDADLDALDLPRIDLALNMVSFQEMTSAQVRRYIERADSLAAPYLYSLNRDRSPYNRELTSVREIIGERYWPRIVPVLPVPYNRMLDRASVLRSRIRRLTGPRTGDLEYRHVLGVRRRST